MGISSGSIVEIMQMIERTKSKKRKDLKQTDITIIGPFVVEVNLRG